MSQLVISGYPSSLTALSIPFHKPFLTGNEMRYLAEATSAGVVSSDNVFSQKCVRILEDALAIKKIYLMPSGTHALESAAILCDLKPGDEVVMPSFTFPSTANSIVRLGAKPIFVEIREDTLNINEELIEAALTPRTKAIFPVHYNGVGCDMDRIMAIAARHQLVVVEDAAQGVNAFYKGRALGSIGHLGAYSFHSTKNYFCGEGGALCVNVPELTARAEIIRDKGTDRSRFLRGEVDKYTWIDVGSSYVPSELVCAFLAAQLEMLEGIKDLRRQVYLLYEEHLRPLEEEGLLRRPRVPAECDINYHMYYVLLPSATIRDALMQYLRQNRIHAVFHYSPLHSSPMGEKLGYQENDLPLTKQLSARQLRLPFYPQLTEEDISHIAFHLKFFLGGAKSPDWYNLTD